MEKLRNKKIRAVVIYLTSALFCIILGVFANYLNSILFVYSFLFASILFLLLTLYFFNQLKIYAKKEVKNLEVLSKVQGSVIGIATHQLRTPLTAIKWMAELLKNGDMGELNKEQKEMLESVLESSDRMRKLLSGLEKISQISDKGIQVESTSTNLGELMKDIMNELESRFKAKKIKVISKIDHDIGKVLMDDSLIRQVYRSLLVNSLKYTPEEGRVVITVTKDEDTILTRITDSGCGIDESELTKIFNKFYRGKRTKDIEANSMGLGLYIAKAFVEASKGKIWAENNTEKGASFVFNIPLLKK